MPAQKKSIYALRVSSYYC